MGNSKDGAADTSAGGRAVHDEAAETVAVLQRPRPSAAAPDEVMTLPAGTQLGPWAIERPIGRGGMGEVYLARRADGTFELQAAIKLLKRGLDTDAVVARFGRERRLLAQLAHPNIAHVLDAGAAPDGRPYLAMEYVDGKPITEYARGRQLDAGERLRLMITVCEAVQAAHMRKIVHRDLKPSNVQVTGDGQIKLLDFGIAKALAEDDTESTLMAGDGPALTPAYAAPEQFLGRPPSAATDVYALGVMLYQLLTENLPHRRENRSATEILLALDRETVPRPSAALRRERGLMPEPERLRRLRHTAGDLDLIVLKAMHADPLRRYADAGGLADDLRRQLEHRPVLARPDSLAYRVGRFGRRNRTLLLQLGASAVAFALVTAALLGMQARRHAEAAYRQHLQRLVDLGQEELAGEHQARAAAYLSAAYSGGNHEVPVRFLLARALPPTLALEPLMINAGPKGIVGIAFSGDGKRLAVSNSDKGGIWDAHNGARLATLDGPGLDNSEMQFTPDGSRLMSGGDSDSYTGAHATRIWDTATGKLLVDVPEASFSTTGGSAFYAADAAFSRFVGLAADGAVRLHDARSGAELKRFATPADTQGASLSPDARWLVTTSPGSGDQVWNTDSGRLRCTVALPAGVSSVAFFSPDAKLLYTGSDHGQIKIWDAATCQLRDALGGHASAVGGASFSPSGNELLTVGLEDGFKLWDLASGGQLLSGAGDRSHLVGQFNTNAAMTSLLLSHPNGEDSLWDLRARREVAHLQAQRGYSGYAVYSPDGHRLAVGSYDGTVRFWDVERIGGNLLAALEHGPSLNPGEQNGTRGARFDASGQHILTAGTDGTARLWDAASHQLLREFKGHHDTVTQAAISRDGARVATASLDKTVMIWDAQSAQPLLTLRDEGSRPHAVIFSADGRVLATRSRGAKDPVVRLWDVASGKLLARLPHGGEVIHIEFSRDGRYLASASFDHTAKIWAVPSGQLLHTFTSDQGEMQWAAFSPDGSAILTLSNGDGARLWRSADYQPLASLADSGGTHHYSGIFSADGQRVAIGGTAGNALVWMPYRNTTLPLDGVHERLNAMDFSSDGTRIAGGSNSGDSYVWDAASGHLLAKYSTVPEVYSVAFSPDGNSLVNSGNGNPAVASLWDVHLEQRTPEQVAAAVRCGVPWRVEGEKLVEQAADPAACAAPQ